MIHNWLDTYIESSGLRVLLEHEGATAFLRRFPLVPFCTRYYTTGSSMPFPTRIRDLRRPRSFMLVRLVWVYRDTEGVEGREAGGYIYLDIDKDLWCGLDFRTNVVIGKRRFNRLDIRNQLAHSEVRKNLLSCHRYYLKRWSPLSWNTPFEDLKVYGF